MLCGFAMLAGVAFCNVLLDEEVHMMPPIEVLYKIEGGIKAEMACG